MSHTTDAVYGISREVPLNYVSRRAVDDEFVSNLSRDKHVVIYGSSKQGKTSLRKYCLKEDDYIAVQCGNRWTLTDLHNNVLKRAGFQLEATSKITTTGKHKISAKFGIKAHVIEAGVGGERSTGQETERTFEPIELDPDDPNDVIEALKAIGFGRFIVLEDFHYLPQDTQKDFAVALKAFHERSKLCFIIVGVWLEENRLVVYNGDLTGRIVAVNADKWTTDELRKVIAEGSHLLNVTFSEKVIAQLLDHANDSVYIVQEACRRICLESNVNETQKQNLIVGAHADVSAIVNAIVSEQSARYRSFISQFAEGFTQTRLEMYKWILFPILRATKDQSEAGFRYASIRRLLEARHPSGAGFNAGNLTQALQSVSSLQVQKGIKPIVLDYDSTNLKLNIVDRGFIIWLGQQNKTELLREVGLPPEEETQDLLTHLNGDANA
jgi:hypothetical protein